VFPLFTTSILKLRIYPSFLNDSIDSSAGFSIPVHQVCISQHFPGMEQLI
jgi:hypothetical protein